MNSKVALAVLALAMLATVAVVPIADISAADADGQVMLSEPQDEPVEPQNGNNLFYDCLIVLIILVVVVAYLLHARAHPKQ
jgi:uncharacterized membrane protein YjgN (DUF898 family)